MNHTSVNRRTGHTLHLVTNNHSTTDIKPDDAQGNNAPDTGPWEGDLDDTNFQTLARATGDDFKRHAIEFLQQHADTTALHINRTRYLELWPIDAIITLNAGPVALISHGCFDNTRLAGLKRTDTVIKMLGTIHSLAAANQYPVLVITSHLPEPNSRAARLLAAASTHLGPALLDVIATTADFAGSRRLHHLLHTNTFTPTDAPWRHANNQLQLFATGGS
jgi:hypothetical protein